MVSQVTLQKNSDRQLLMTSYGLPVPTSGHWSEPEEDPECQRIGEDHVDWQGGMHADNSKMSANYQY